ncbi:MAG: hypothetical protein SF187_12720 [Deltaproteobacteria bacterium]|nr:hypothetical protein [Deltaproteobacteria bacterium]
MMPPVDEPELPPDPLLLELPPDPLLLELPPDPLLLELPPDPLLLELPPEPLVDLPPVPLALSPLSTPSPAQAAKTPAANKSVPKTIDVFPANAIKCP